MAWLLKYSTTENRINHRHTLRTQAENKAEAVIEYELAQLSHVIDENTTIASAEFKSSRIGALVIPPKANLRGNVGYARLEFYRPSILSSNFSYIDPSKPDNLFDPLKGKYLRAFEVTLYEKATITNPSDAPKITSYVTQVFQVRGSPLFPTTQV